MRDVNDVVWYVQNLLTQAAPQKGVVAVLGIVVAYFFPEAASRSLAVWALVLVFLDMITAQTAAIKTGEAIDSMKIGRTGSKLVGYGTLVVISVFISRNAPFLGTVRVGGIDATTMGVVAILAFICYQEVVSILENVQKIGVDLGPLAGIISGRKKRPRPSDP